MLSFRIAALGVTLLDRIKLFSIFLIGIAKKRFDWKTSAKPYNVRIKKFGHSCSFTLYGLRDELELLKDIFADGEYALGDKISDPRIIFDIGSNIGVSAMYYALKYPKATIYAFEANPRISSILAHNLDQFENVRIYNTAIGSEDAEHSFYINERAISSSTKERSGTVEEIKVPMRSLDSMIKELNIGSIDIVKFDVEGGEYNIFSYSNSLEKIQCLVGELHPGLMGISNAAFKHFIEREGYSVTLSEKENSARAFIYGCRNQ